MKTEILQFYSQHGWQIFPVKPHDKTPLVKWADEATTDWNKITEWVGSFADMNVGIATGKRSGIFVLDIDAGHDGYQSLDELEKKFGKLPETPTVRTGGGGKHLFFKHPDFEIRNVQNSGKLGKGIDVRGDGGYVVGAPSIHNSGNQYTWIVPPSKTPLAEAPKWLLDLLKQSQVKELEQQQSGNVAIPNGGRNNTLTSLAGAMRRKGMGQDAIYQALLAENKEKCFPPLTDREVSKIAESVFRYSPIVTFDDHKDRLQVEWSFCKSIYQFPLNLDDFRGIPPEMFSDHQLEDFWRDVLNNVEVTEAAIKAGIASELERYKDFDVSRLDGYARSIQRFAYLASIEKAGENLIRSARTGNDASISQAVDTLNRIPSQGGHKVISIGDTAEELELEIIERSQNPVDVWGIPYAFKYLSILTGGKQKGELTIHAAEPKIGKSWWQIQDILETGIKDTPVFYWCGEMKRKQIMRRMYQLLGVNGRNMKTGQMTQQDWDLLADAKALILNSPIFIDDTPLSLHEVRPLLVKQKIENGIQQACFDYAKLIYAPGKDEIEQTQNVSMEMKKIASDLDLSITLIASVNKQGMDTKSEYATKSSVRGSGQQIHDADVIYIMTKFDGKNFGTDYGIMPADYDRCVSLHITAGRELDHQIENGFIPYMRQENSPKFLEIVRKP